MEKAQLCKRAYNNQLQQSICLCHKRKMSQIWQVSTLWHSQSERSHNDSTPTHPNQCPYQVSPLYTLWNPKNSLDKILKLMVIMTRLNQGHTMTVHTYNPYKIL